MDLFENTNYFCYAFAMEEIIEQEITDADWDSFVSSSEYSGFMQSSDWAKVKKEEGWSFAKIAIKERGTIRAAALILMIKTKSGTLLYSPQGPIIPWHNFRKRNFYLEKLIGMVQDIAQKNGGVCWRMEPWALHMYGKPLLQFQKSPMDMQPRHTALISLLGSEEEILEKFKPKTRYNIRLAQKHNLGVEIGQDKKSFETFYSVYRKTVDRKAIDYKELPYFASIQKYLATKDQAFVINIKKDGQYIESVLLIRFGDRLTYFFGGFDYEYRKYMAPYLVHWEAIKLGRKLGCQFYDLWGIANTESADHPWHSFTEFKMKFQPIKISLTGAYDVVFDKERYKEFFAVERGQ